MMVLLLPIAIWISFYALLCSLYYELNIKNNKNNDK